MRFLLMLSACIGVCQGAYGQTEDHHARTNTLYRELIDKGVTVTDKTAMKLPTPSMADGLDKAGQMKVVKQLAREDYSLDELVRNSIVAPHIYKFREIDTGDLAKTGRGVDLWFVAYGKYELLNAQQLQAQFGGNRGGNKMTPIKEADLTKRNIKLKGNADVEESYTHTVAALLERVQISSTNHGTITRSKDSIVMAASLDPRFAKDADYPNQWRSIKLEDDGKEMLGAPQPYDGAAMYIKLTRLHEPEGAVFIEYHQVFTEPKKWFDAPNMLKSKLPIVIQSEVRAFRRELLKLKAKQ